MTYQTSAIQTITSMLVNFGALLVSWVIQVAKNGGYTLTPLMAGLVLLAVLGAVFSFLGKHLPWYVDVGGFIVFISVIAYTVSSTLSSVA